LHCNVGHLLQGSLVAVVVHLQVLHQAGVRASGPQLLHVGLEGLHAFGHAYGGVLFEVIEHMFCSWKRCYSNVTLVPTSSPFTIRVRSPELLRLNTRKGKRLSRHMTMAVASITFSLSVSTLSKVNVAYRTAAGLRTGSS